MDSLIATLSDKAIELVIAATIIVILSIGRIIFVKERKASYTNIEINQLSNEQLAELIHSLDRSMAQRFDSLARHTETKMGETQKETTRQFERLHDRLNQFRSG